MRTQTNIFARLATYLFLFSLFFACKKDSSKVSQISKNLSAYVYAYTSGVISKASSLTIRFTQAVVEEDEIGQQAKKVLNISPKVVGNATWQDAQTLVFEPDNYFSSNTTYHVSVDLDDLFAQLPKDLSTFSFDFQTRQQDMRVAIDKVAAKDENDLREQEIFGSIYTADLAEIDHVKAALSAKQNGKNLPIQVNEAGEMKYDFVVEEVERAEKASEVQISWNGKAIGADRKGEKAVEILALGDFSVTDARLVQGNEQYILLNFSDPLQKEQDLSGLIDISGYNGSMRYVIDGNQIRVYTTSRLRGEKQVSTAVGIKNINGKRIPKASVWTLSFEEIKPQVRLVGKGVILPSSEGMLFPFEAVSLNAVEVEIFKIFNNNILQFLQTNELNGNRALNRVGRIIYQGRVDLEGLEAAAATNSWTRYALNLDQFIEDDPEAIYQVRIGFRPEYSTYFCGNNNSEAAALTVVNEEQVGEIESFWDSYYGFSDYYDGYWRDRENPCKTAYYNREVFARRNVFSSNLGIIAKEGKDQSILVSVSDLRTAQPISNVTLEFYDYQQQKIKTATTDNNGTAMTQLERSPFVVLAKKDSERGYLRLRDGDALSLSRFDVSGAVTQEGMKGYLYGERGVWRPGDSIYLNFVLENENGNLPSNYPITFELYDARGQLQSRRNTSESVGNIYALHTATTIDAPTGNWTATVKAGGATFSKTLKIETVKPNRLKLDLDFGKEQLSYEDEPVRTTLDVKWLHGAVAQNLKAKVELSINPGNTTFKAFKEYEFDDPARVLNSEPKTVFDGQVNQEGRAIFTTEILGDALPAGRIRASFKARAFEEGGDFSTRNKSVLYDPYENYAGIFIPENKYGEKRLEIDENEAIDFALVNKNGQPVRNKNLSIGLYRIEWRWWWDQSRDNVTRYNSSSHYDAIKKENITTDGKGEAQWNLKVGDWGRYLVRVCDTESGHCAGDYFYAGYPWYD
ncbi:MAG: MG2 domain-containing protein, partial [Bacteroidota bacterium]